MKFSLDRTLALIIGVYLVVTMGGELWTALAGLGARTEGQIVSATAQRRGLSYEIRVAYDYRVGEKIYRGERLNSANFGYYLFSADEAREVLSRLTPGTRREARYQPSRPERSYLYFYRRYDEADEFYFLLIGLLFVGWGLGVHKILWAQPWMGGGSRYGATVIGRDLEDTLEK